MELCILCDAGFEDRNNNLCQPICDDCDEFMDECDRDHDGQPDEAQEWEDFDPDCQGVLAEGLRL